MKNLLLIFCLYCCSVSMNAQTSRDKQDRIKAIKVAYITEEINLTSQQSQQFWPLYNEYHSSLKVINQSVRTSNRLRDMTDEQISIFIEKKLNTEEAKIDLQRKYLKMYKEVLSIRQIAQLYRAEIKFKKELLRRAKERRALRD